MRGCSRLTRIFQTFKSENNDQSEKEVFAMNGMMTGRMGGNGSNVDFSHPCTGFAHYRPDQVPPEVNLSMG